MVSENDHAAQGAQLRGTPLHGILRLVPGDNALYLGTPYLGSAVEVRAETHACPRAMKWYLIL